MKLADTIDSVQQHLKGLRIKPKLVKAAPAKAAKVLQTEKKLMPLPEQLKAIYVDFSNGLVFHWSSKDAFGSLLIPSLEQLVENFQGWKKLVMWMDDYKFPHVADPAQARP